MRFLSLLLLGAFFKKTLLGAFFSKISLNSTSKSYMTCKIVIFSYSTATTTTSHDHSTHNRPLEGSLYHAPPGPTPWPSKMLPLASTATMGLRRWAGDDSPYHAREAPAFAKPCL